MIGDAKKFEFESKSEDGKTHITTFVIPANYQKKPLLNCSNWVNALRSGEYNQGKTALCAIRDSVEYYCCLGVACSLIDKTPIVEGYDCSSGVNEQRKIFFGRPSSLSSNCPLFESLGALGYFPKEINLYSNFGYCLATLNDSLNFTFKQIADVIELIWEDPK